MDPWKWCVENIDFSLAPSYKSAWTGKYNPDLMPYFREPMECFDNPEVREIVLLKNTQSGGSEHLILMPMRYAAVNRSDYMLYVGAEREATETYFEERIKRGMMLSEELQRVYAKAGFRKNAMDIGACSIAYTWEKSKAGLKQRPVDTVFVDEVSSFKDVSALEEARKRMATRPEPKLVLCGSLDVKRQRATEDDPMWIEWKSTDQREWMVVDPVTGNRFKFDFGGVGCPFGVKWAPESKRSDGSWDFDAVRRTAHYITPDGTRIEEAQRLAVIATGEWQATAKADSVKRGYRINQLLFPFEYGTFGHIACHFLNCVKNGREALKAFAYEVMAEAFSQEIERPRDDALDERAFAYAKGDVIRDGAEFIGPKPGKLSDGVPFTGPVGWINPKVICTVDVQQDHVFYVIREWHSGGHSCLIEWGNVVLWEDLEARFDYFDAKGVFIDNTYAKRQREVAIECLNRQMVPCHSNDALKLRPFRIDNFDPYEGTSRQSRRNVIARVIWSSSTFKPLAMDMINGKSMSGPSAQRWHIYQGIERTYVTQLLSEELTEKGWVLRRGRTQNHLWDCEVLQVLGATLKEYLQAPIMLAEKLAVPQEPAL